MFLDEATIAVHGGNGGRGCVSWRREKFEPMGGPDGGTGGKGGNVIIMADENTDTLSDFASRKKFEALKGRFGSGSNRNGKAGEDMVLLVPPGTLVYEISPKGEHQLAADLGEPGEKKMIKLELKLVADIGIIGYPSVGKSTLISVVSSARPKIADYPFTTLIPNLGVVNVADRSFIICDVPGLIEGASEGKGLGHEFLKHIDIADD